jgi:hypothetical protein
MKNFDMSDLETDNVVETRSGNKMILIEDPLGNGDFVFMGEVGYGLLGEWDDNFKHDNIDSLDIIKVYQIKRLEDLGYAFMDDPRFDGELVWEENPRLTEEQKKEYMSKRGNHCPACGSKDIYSIGDLESVETDTVWNEMSCVDCSKSWVEVYRLADIQEVEEKVVDFSA